MKNIKRLMFLTMIGAALLAQTACKTAQDWMHAGVKIADCVVDSTREAATNTVANIKETIKAP